MTTAKQSAHSTPPIAVSPDEAARLAGIAALVSLKIKHVDLREQSVTQNPREVATKFGKVIDTFFAKEFEEAERGQ